MKHFFEWAYTVEEPSRRVLTSGRTGQTITLVHRPSRGRGEWHWLVESPSATSIAGVASSRSGALLAAARAADYYCYSELIVSAAVRGREVMNMDYNEKQDTEYQYGVGRLHTISRLSATNSAAAHEVFRRACAVTSPKWTQCGPHPGGWHAPPDAAGGLVLWDAHGELIRVEPSVSDSDQRNAAEATLHRLKFAGALVGVVRASYASSGGRMVALCSSYGEWYVTVSRSDGPPRVGGTEQCLRAADPRAVVRLLTVYSEAENGQTQI